jgi:hypothetical protein
MAVEALHNHRQHAIGRRVRSKPWVFSDTRGGLLCRHNLLSRSFGPILKAANVRTIRFHDLRHTAATLMLAEGINPRLVSEVLGHAEIAFRWMSTGTPPRDGPGGGRQNGPVASRQSVVTPIDGNPIITGLATKWLHFSANFSCQEQRNPYICRLTDR